MESKNILVIGNGFDLEHDLPTKYTDFLKFVEEFSRAHSFANETPPRLFNIKSDYFKRIFENSKFKDRVNALHALINKNLWIDYFQKVHRKHWANKENWIDFENEISDIIQTMDKLIKCYQSAQMEGNKNESEEIRDYKKELSKIINHNSQNETGIKVYIPTLLKDLNRLIGALEIYIWDYVGKIEFKYYNPDIEKIHPDRVLSFNYSDTYRNIYAFNRKDIKYSFAHGIAANNIHFFTETANAADGEIEDYIQRNAENNNMVLGVDEYLPEDRRSKEVDFIAFKKYYQRIYKKAGNEYKKWLQQIDENIKAGRKEENTVYIFEHSLDITDGDILREFINHNGVKTIIFYRNKEQLGQQIANLVKILTSEEVINKVYGSNPTIVFKKQSERKIIQGSPFEIASDTMQFENIYRWSRFEAQKLITKIKNKIEEKDLQYFYSQEDVITLFDVMQKNGLTTLYKTKLLEIAYELMKCDGLQKPEQFDAESWSYHDYDDSLGCDPTTQVFVASINSYNRKNFIASEDAIQSFDEQLAEYQKLIDCEEILDKEGYKLINKKIFNMRHEKDDDIEKIWNMLLRISRGPGEEVAKETLKELLDASKDEFDIIRYNHLLSEIQMNEYFDMKAEEFEESYRAE